MRLLVFLFFMSIGSYVLADGPQRTDNPNGSIFHGDLTANTIGYETITNWDTAVAVVHNTTGVDDHDLDGLSCKVTVNSGDNTKIDIGLGPGCFFHIQGPEYELPAAIGLDPNFAVDENSRHIGVTMNGYTSQTSRFTAAQQRTIVPIGRLNTALGVLGPGSAVHLVRDDRYFVSERDYEDRAYFEEAVGARYVSGGELFSYSTIVMGQTAGVLYNAQKNRHELAAFNTMTAIYLHHIAGVFSGSKERFVVDNLQYDDGTDLQSLISNRWTNISVLKSPKGANGTQEGGWFYVYGDQYNTQAGAEAAGFDFAEFQSQGFSGITPLASIIVKQGGETLDVDLFIIDKRSCEVCRP